jgi:hypothetical protein
MHIFKKITVYQDIIQTFNKTKIMKETKNGKCAIQVINRLKTDSKNLLESKIKEIWIEEMKKLTSSEDSINKCCPRKTLIGLILNNKTIINSEKNDNFKSKNYDYVRFIIEEHLTDQKPILKTDKLKYWKLIQNKFDNAPKNQNGQLDVLFTLHQNNLLK